MAKNLSLLCKWKWKFYSEKEALWCQVIKEFYGAVGGLSSPSNSCGIGGMWCDILKAIENIEDVDNSFKNSFVLKILSGSNSLFWKGPWCGNGQRLMDIYPRLFALEVQKDYKINERWCLISDVWGGNWAWRIPSRGRALEDLSSLISRIGDLHLSSNGRDKCTWTGDASGPFKVRNLVKSIENQLLRGYVIGKHHHWISWIPRKVNIFSWRASLNRLPTRLNLALRGISLPTTCCPFCEEDNEVLDHCIINCPSVLGIWRKVWSWWNLDLPLVFPSFSISDISLGNVRTRGDNRANKVLNGVLHCTIWSIWKWRNKVINADEDSVSRIMNENIFPSIQRIARY
ncbi:RNA-directed DNA polymerase, eukaryota, reverse transcriptase zinc-binding domain protein [Tanacetum coccineum]